MATISQLKAIMKPVAKAVLTGAPNAPRLGFYVTSGPGVGKSGAIYQLGEELSAPVNEGGLGFNVPVYEIRGSCLADPSFVTGIPDVSGAVTVLKRMNMLPPENTPAILFIDELGGTHQQIRNALTQLIYDKKAGEYVLDARTFIVCAGNRASDRAGSTKVETHVGNRLRHYTVEADLKEWQAFVAAKKLPPMLIAFLEQNPALLHKFDAKSEDLAFPSPRTWEEVAIDMTIFTTPSEILMSAASLVGEGPAAELAAFLTRAQAIPSWQVFRAMSATDATDLLKGVESSVQYAAMTMSANAIETAADVDWVTEVLVPVSPELMVAFTNMANTVFRKHSLTLKSAKLLEFAKKQGVALFRS